MNNKKWSNRFRTAMILVLLNIPIVTKADVKLYWECGSRNGPLLLKYDSSEESELVRAFALDIVATGGIITDINDFAVGTDNGGYGIFPGSFSRYINVDPLTGDVENWDVPAYSPVADGNDPGALPGIGSYGVTIEMASLYDTNSPGTTGTLFSIRSEGADLIVTVNNTRGGIVLENGKQATADLSEAVAMLGICDLFFPTHYSTYPDWIAFGRPLCWCEPYQCDGDASGLDSGIGSKKTRINTNDLRVLIDNWGLKGTEPRFNPCADVDHKAQGIGPYKTRVGTNDLQILVNNWNKKASELPGDCPRQE